MKSALFLATTFLAAPLAAQAPSADPLAPMPSAPVQIPPLQTAPQVVSPAPPPAPVIAIPKDWRGVFDAIRAGNWASARAGIAVLPPGVLTPLARAELYTAKGSPTVDVGSLRALVTAAPELPHAGQLARMATTRAAPAHAANRPPHRPRNRPSTHLLPADRDDT